MSNGVNQCAACGGLWGDDEPHVACPSDHPSDPTDKAVALLKTIGLDITYTDEGLRLKTAEEIRAEARADVFRVFNSDPGKHSITNEQHVLFCAECHALRHLYEQGKRDAAAPRTLTADDRAAIARRVDAALAAMPTGFWINANTEEAQAHKRYVRDALAPLIHDGEDR